MVHCIIDEIDGVTYMYFKTEMFIAVTFQSFHNLLKGNWKAQSKNDPLIFRPFLKVFRSSWILACGHFQKWPKNQGIVLALSPPIVCTVKSAVKQMEYSNPVRFQCMGQWELSHSYV